MLQIIERYEDVDGVRVRVESGFDAPRPEAQAPTLSSLAKAALLECEDRTDDAVDLLVEWLVDDPVLQRAIIDAAVIASINDEL